MVSQIKYAQKIDARSGEYYNNKYFSSFSNLDGLKGKNQVASCLLDAAGGRNVYIPTLEFSDFGFNIPETAKIDKIIVYYNQRIDNITIPKAIISASVNGAVSESASLSTNFSSTDLNVEFQTTDMNLGWIDPKNINDSFSIRFWYNENTGGAGTFEIKNVSVEIQYSIISLEISVSEMTTSIIYPNTNFGFNLHLDRNGGFAESKVLVTIEASSNVKIIENNSIIFNQSNNRYEWNVQFEKLEDEFIANCVFQAEKPGDYKIRITETVNNTFKEYNFTVQDNKTMIQVSTPESMKRNEKEEITIYNNYLGTPTESRDCTIIFPAHFNISVVDCENGSANVTSTSSETMISWNIPSDIGLDTLRVSIQPTIEGTSTYMIYDDYGALIGSGDIIVIPENYTLPFFARYDVGDETLDLMDSGGVVYTAISFIKLEVTANIDDVYKVYEDFQKNHRFCVFHDRGVAENNDSEMINSAQRSEFLPLGGGWFQANISFTYDELSNLVLYWTGEFLEKDTSLVNVLFSTPIIMETPYYFSNGLEEYGLYPSLLKSLISENTFGEVSVPSFRTTNPFKTYSMDMDGIDKKENFVFQGILIKFDYECSSDCGVIAKVINKSKNISGQRSVMLHAGSGSAEIGGTFDLFGLSYQEIVDANSLETEFNIFNPYQNDVTVKIKNIRFEMTWSILDNEDWLEFWINGESSRYYNCFLRDLTILGGVDTNVEDFNVDGNDVHTPYRQSIESKELELNFAIDSCHFVDSTALFERAARWLMNDRDQYNRPIPNIIEFEHIPGMQFKYILESGIDETIENGVYDCTAKLLIPSGTMESKESSLTSNIGYNDSIAKVSPIVRVRALYNDVEVAEKNSNQLFNVSSDKIETNDILIIDCENRIVTLLKQKVNGSYEEFDISSSVSFDSDWLIIFPRCEYNFDCNGTATFQSVEFRERW